ncbi:ANTAR domain-containing protein [Nocardia sp. bgisy134]|uniref:GAF and ANTAR domain-containing protein n=1 Tax=unclassified Nocardia TaxID=2637762 RepID=UPI003D750773
MSDSEQLVTALSGIVGLLPEPGDVVEPLHRVIDSATDALDLAGCAVLLVAGGHSSVVTATPAALADVALSQRSSERGPAVDALRHGEPVAVADVRERHEAWPEYTSVAVRHGVRAVAEIPMRSGVTMVGALGMYAYHPRQWTEPELSVGALLASLAAGHILTAERLRAQQRLAEQLQHALDSRVLVEQAKGVLANARNTTPQAAYELIRAHARRHRVSVHAVAGGIVELGLRI